MKFYIWLFPLVPGVGLEPTRYYYRQILSLLRLPIPPPRHYIELAKRKTGFEPATPTMAR